VVLVIDNYDSFTYNIVQYVLELGAEVDVVRNDEVTVPQVRAHDATHLLMSPGPGRPEQSGVCQELARAVCDDLDLPTLGVCLGHQTLCEVHGAEVVRASRIMHGKVSEIEHDGATIFSGIPSPYQATRYHSLIVTEATLPLSIVATARTPEGELMAVQHVSRPVYGVQFHPESILSAHGHTLLGNFLRAARQVE
jgi:anthranilate synthase/aminodeoxychorismate synthase-like glutamine amidotransferase